MMIFLINRCFSIVTSSVLITQLFVATFLFYWLHSVSWLRSGMFGNVPIPLVASLFTIVIFLLDDFSKYWVHRWMHNWPILWALHKVHHSASVLTPLTVYRTHPLEGIVFTIRGSLTQGTAIAFFIFFFGEGVDLITILGANIFLFIFNSAGSNLRHSHVGISYWRWLEWFLISPAQHQLHHSTAVRHHNKNFGATLAIWDTVFGSIHHSEAIEGLRLGLDSNEDHSDAIVGIYLYPVYEIFKIIRENIRKIVSTLKG